jgi:hypothetical protein
MLPPCIHDTDGDKLGLAEAVFSCDKALNCVATAVLAVYRQEAERYLLRAGAPLDAVEMWMRAGEIPPMYMRADEVLLRHMFCHGLSCHVYQYLCNKQQQS